MCGENRCSAWISLSSVGIAAEGCIKDPAFVSSVYPLISSSQQGKAYMNLPCKRLLYIETIAQGQFGYIDLAQYQVYDEKKEVYVKRPILHDNLLMEACIQKLVGESLVHAGFPLGAPPLISIFALQNGSVCFSMEPIRQAVTLNHFLDAATPYSIGPIIIDCLLQLCAMLSHLHADLGMNHRDLKPSNFLIREHQPIEKRLVIDGEQITILSRYSLTMIDFGFACLGPVRQPNGSDVSLSTVYSVEDCCPKEGRDLFIFLGMLYAEYHKKLPPTLLTLFESWIDLKLCAFMQKNQEYSMRWLYFMAGNERILRFPSTPLRILKDLQAL
jgi:serine/threonine protein kinase